MNLPSYLIEIKAVQARTPKVGDITQEQYDQWIADEDHIRFEQQCDAGQIFFWAARVTETREGVIPSSNEMHSLPFDTKANTGATRLKDFVKDLSLKIGHRAKETMGDDESRIIRP